MRDEAGKEQLHESDTVEEVARSPRGVWYATRIRRHCPANRQNERQANRPGLPPLRRLRRRTARRVFRSAQGRQDSMRTGRPTHRVRLVVPACRNQGRVSAADRRCGGDRRGSRGMLKLSGTDQFRGDGYHDVQNSPGFMSDGCSTRKQRGKGGIRRRGELPLVLQQSSRISR